MGKIIVFNMISVDGYFAGPDGNIDWHTVDEEFNEFAIDQLNTADGLIFGRVTYELMASYWPTPAALHDDPIIAKKMNSIPKFVASRTLQSAGWNNTTLIQGNITDEFKRLKERPGQNLFIFGSANLVTDLIHRDLIDEYRLIVSPVVLGSGQPAFQKIHGHLHLKLVRTRLFQNGNILLVYQPDRDKEVEG